MPNLQKTHGGHTDGPLSVLSGEQQLSLVRMRRAAFKVELLQRTGLLIDEKVCGTGCGQRCITGCVEPCVGRGEEHFDERGQDMETGERVYV